MKELPEGGMVLVLETGAVIKPEDEAMLQALHSRSTGGIMKHLGTLERHGSGKMMETFYIGYGHKSIGDCGHGIIFIEGVSMLAAKAVQDWRLYNGQEASTRYIDFAKQKFLDPIDTRQSNALLEFMRDVYLNGLEPAREMFRKRHPYKKEWDEQAYEKTITARSFDVMRGFLPAGATTNLSWSGNLRQTADKLMMLRHHPLKEVRNIACAMQCSLEKHFQNSFGQKRYEETEEYDKWWMTQHYYHHLHSEGDFNCYRNGIDKGLLLDEYKKAISTRPPKQSYQERLKSVELSSIGFYWILGRFVMFKGSVLLSSECHYSQHILDFTNGT